MTPPYLQWRLRHVFLQHQRGTTVWGTRDICSFHTSPWKALSPSMSPILCYNTPSPLYFLQMRLELYVLLICLEIIKQHMVSWVLFCHSPSLHCLMPLEQQENERSLIPKAPSKKVELLCRTPSCHNACGHHLSCGPPCN